MNTKKESRTDKKKDIQQRSQGYSIKELVGEGIVKELYKVAKR